MKIKFRYPFDETTGAVLAGGRSSRMGRDKGLMEMDGIALTERMWRLLKEVCPKAIIIANRNGYEKIGAEVYNDLIPGKGPMGGIHTALQKAETPFVLTLACDMPFANARMLNYIIQHAGTKYDAVVPVHENMPQPLCAVYQKTCLPGLEEMMNKGNYKLQYLLATVSTRLLMIDKKKDWYSPNLFMNVNTPDDFQKALQA